MKIRLVVALVGLAINFAVPAFAQQKDATDPQIAEQLSAISEETNDAFNKGDAAALGELYTEDAVLVTNTGPIYGREVIEKHYAELFQTLHFSNHLDKRDQYSPHIIGTAGNEAWSNGEWTQTLQSQKGPIQLKGYWSEIYVREGDTWKKRLDVWNITSAPAATPSPTTTPSNR
jgi:ketosteroid isomerase-like protein